MEELESCLNGQKFRNLCRTPEGLKDRGDLEADGKDGGAPIRVVGRRGKENYGETCAWGG